MDETDGSGEVSIPEDASTKNLDLEDRDPKKINVDVFKISFEDVIAEPAGMHSLNIVWKASHAVFTYSQLFLYRSLSTIFGLFLSLIWGSLLAVLMFLHIWLLGPCFKSILQCIVRPYTWFIHTFLGPLLQIFGKMAGIVMVYLRKKQ